MMQNLDHKKKIRLVKNITRPCYNRNCTEKEIKMSDTQVYYIHGFGSTPESDTVKLLRKDFPDAIGLTYDHSDPAESIKSLISIINSCTSYPIVIGSSLGGWYVEQLSRFVVADYILYNPSTQPEVTLARHGLTQDVLFKYKQISSPYKFLPTSRSIILSVDDEIIDYKIAYIKYNNVGYVQLTDGGHRMTPTNMQLIVTRINYLRNQI